MFLSWNESYSVNIPDDPAFIIGGRPISDANSFVFDQLIEETNTVLKTSFSPLFYAILYLRTGHPNKK